MKRMTISLEEENYNYLKQLKTDRSIARNLNDLLSALREAGATVRPAIVSTTLIDTKIAPEGTTIKTKVTSPPKPLTEEEKLERFQKKAKKIVGHELELEEDYMLMDIQSDNIYYDKNYEKLYREGGSLKVVYIYDLPEERQEEYLRDFKEWEDHEKAKNRGLNTLGHFIPVHSHHSRHSHHRVLPDLGLF